MGTAIGDDFKLQNSNGKGNRQHWVVLESLFKNRAGSRSSRPKAQVYMCVYAHVYVILKAQQLLCTLGPNQVSETEFWVK